MKRIVALLGAAAALAAIVVSVSGSPASAGQPSLGGLLVTPAMANVGTTVTVTPLAPCPQGSTEADITYFNPDLSEVDTTSLPLDEELGWIDQVAADAGQYVVSADCRGPQNQVNAGHLAARGAGLVVTGSYDDGSFQVNGIVTATPNPTTVELVVPAPAPQLTPNVTLSVAATSACKPAGSFPVGVVSLRVTDPDLLVSDFTPTLATDGTFSLAFNALKAGTYTVTGSCERSATPSAGHLAGLQAVAASDDFTYSGSFTAVYPTPPTPASPGQVAAEAVVANPTFTG